MRFLILIVFSQFLLLACSSESALILPDYILDNTGLESDFAYEDALRYAQNYRAAALAYQRAYAKKLLSKVDSLYLLNQISYCWLMINETNQVKPWMDVLEVNSIERKLLLPIEADYLYNKARLFYLNYQIDSSQFYNHLALKAYRKLYQSNHLKVAQCLTLLSLSHHEIGYVADSSGYYAFQASVVYNATPALLDYAWENDFALACISLSDRAHKRGENHCLSALSRLDKLPDDNPLFKARCLSMWGSMIKKQADRLGKGKVDSLKRIADYDKADKEGFSIALDLAGHLNSHWVQEIHRDRLLNASRLTDSSRFFQYLDDLAAHNKVHDLWHVVPEQLLGFYYYKKEDPDSIIHYYTAVLEHCAIKNSCKRLFIDEAFFLLAEAYAKKGDFDTSLYYHDQNFELYNCAEANLNTLKQQGTNLYNNNGPSCFIIYGLLGSAMLQKYQHTKFLNHLATALDYFEVFEQGFYASVLRADENSVLTFQVETSNKFFLDALEAAYQAYIIDPSDESMNRTLGLMERLKAYLLYRDKLHSQTKASQSISRLDSIRILQGQLNGLQKKGDYQEWGFVQHQINTLLRIRREDAVAFKTLIEQSSPKVQEIQKVLRTNHALIEYTNSSKYLYSMYIDQDTVVINREVKDTVFRNRLRLYRESLESDSYMRSVRKKYDTTAFQLYDYLLSPFDSMLVNKSNLFVIPDDELLRIPFEALLTEAIDSLNWDLNYRTLPYVCRRMEITYGTSLKLLLPKLNQSPKKESGRKLGIWFDPELTTPTFQELRAELEESPGFDTIIPARGKEHFLRYHDQYNLLFLWMHGRSNPDNRFENRIYFSSAQSDTLYGYELSSTVFRASLLVLGSCQTLDGPISKGEGAFSITRSFLQAGVPKVIAALWKVNTETSAELIAALFDHLGQGTPASTALQEAKLDYLKNIPERHKAFPGYWAGFILSN